MGAALAAVVLAVVGAVVGWAVAGDDEPSVHAGSGGPSGYVHYLRLDDGRDGYVAVSGSQDLKVWWHRPRAGKWSAPIVVDGGSGRSLSGTSIRVARSTIAIRAFYQTKGSFWRTEEDNGSAAATSVFVVCRPGSCTASDHYEHVAEPPCHRGSCLLSRPRQYLTTETPELAPDGTQVYLGATERGYVVWSAGRGLREVEPLDLPSDGVLGSPMMAPDGSLRVVSGHHEGDRCRLTLLTSEPVEDSTGRIPFTEQVSTTAPTTTGACETTLEGFASDQLLIHTDRSKPVYLVRNGATWKPTGEDPTGLVRYAKRPGRQAAGSLTRTGYWHRREVAVGSPDGRRLVAQVHFPDAATWTKPVTVAVAPPGRQCFDIAPTSTPSQDPFYVSMRCQYRTSPDADWLNVGVHAVTDNGLSWAPAIGDEFPSRVGKDLYFGGAPAHRWTPGRGLTRIGLPISANSKTFLLDDGTLVLVVAEPVGARCRLVVRIARATDKRWSKPIPSRHPWVPTGAPCRPVGQSGGHVVMLRFPGHQTRLAPALVTRRDSEWQVTTRRRPG